MLALTTAHRFIVRNSYHVFPLTTSLHATNYSYSPVRHFRFISIAYVFIDLCRNLLNYLDQKKISATFFVVGSRVIERPTVLIEEYMAGHEVSVHTWSHRVNISTQVFPTIID